METEQALALVNALADGLDPIAQQPLQSDAPCQQPDCVRALLLAARALEEKLVLERRQATLPRRAGLPWDDAEDRRLSEAYEQGADLNALAALHERSRSAIAARLVKLGHLDPVQAKTRFRTDYPS